jgi:hypothetical protein
LLGNRGRRLGLDWKNERGQLEGQNKDVQMLKNLESTIVRKQLRIRGGGDF